MTYYNRKSPRIPRYDYTSESYYFITICAHNRKCVFGKPEELSDFGEVARRHILDICDHYHDVYIDKFVIMPNHIHFLLVLQKSNQFDVSQIIGSYKSGVTREIRKKIPGICLWQRSFHDHVIRSQADYERIWIYIENNPYRWSEDCFYVDQNS